MSWLHIHEYPIDHHINAGYKVKWYFEGGTGIKRWEATNPEGKTSACRSKDEAMHLCEAGIARRAARVGGEKT